MELVEALKIATDVKLDEFDAREYYIKECRKLKERVKHELYQKLGELPLSLLNPTQNSCILSGGAISSIYHKEQVNDFDLYFKHVDDLDKVANLLSIADLTKIKKTSDESPDEYDIFENGKAIGPNAITLINGIQYIHGRRMTFQYWRDLFDFEHVKPYYDLFTDKLFISQYQFELIVKKQLVQTKVIIDKLKFDPDDERCRKHNSRIIKYSNRGWKFWP